MRRRVTERNVTFFICRFEETKTELQRAVTSEQQLHERCHHAEEALRQATSQVGRSVKFLHGRGALWAGDTVWLRASTPSKSPVSLIPPSLCQRCLLYTSDAADE